MAEVILGVDLPKRNGTRKYPWDEWLDGRTWELKRDIDFDCQMDSFRTAAFSEAKGRNVKLASTLVDDVTIRIQAYERLS